MPLQTRVAVGKDGRFTIPKAMREVLGFTGGDDLELRMIDGELHISSRESRLRRAQEHVRKLVPPGVSLADELSAERREAAKNE
jgi:AbrB family looped-hinge helix DNA binding protein